MSRRKDWIKHGKFSQNSSSCSRLQTCFCQHKKIILTLISVWAGDVWARSDVLVADPLQQLPGTSGTAERVSVKSWCNLFKTTRALVAGGSPVSTPRSCCNWIRKITKINNFQPANRAGRPIFTIARKSVNQNYYRQAPIRNWNLTALTSTTFWG